MNIYVGNLSHEVTETELRLAFEQYGKVDTVRLIKDRYSGLSRGFAFVEMSKNSEAEAAINGLNKKEFAGRTLDISEAHPPREKTRDYRPGGGSRTYGNRPSGGGNRAGRQRRGSGGGRRRF